MTNRDKLTRKLRIVVAGVGIGELVFALADKRKGFEVVVFDKDLSAIRGEVRTGNPFRYRTLGPAVLLATESTVLLTASLVNGKLSSSLLSNFVNFLCCITFILAAMKENFRVADTCFEPEPQTGREFKK